MRNRFVRPLVPLALLGILAFSSRNALADVATFDDLSLAPNSFWDGPDPNGTTVAGPFGPEVVGGFRSAGVTFTNVFDKGFGDWSGFAYSNTSDTTTPGFTNQFSAFTGTGRDPGRDNYAVAFGHHDLTANAAGNTPFDPTNVAQLLDLPHLTLPSGSVLQGLYVTNTTYTALSMLDGDSFAKKFGGASGNDPDYLLLTAYGIDASGHVLANHVDFYLADYRSANNALDYVLNTWQYMDLSALAGASTIAFNLTSSDVGQFGMNTPSYFAIDDVQFTTSVPEPSGLSLVAIGLVGIGRLGRRRRGMAGILAGLLLLAAPVVARASYDPQVGQPGSLGIAATSPGFVEWASSVVSINRGPQDISNPSSSLASAGDPSNALGAIGTDTSRVVSLGDGGSITLGFAAPIANGAGADFAVFENGFLSGSAGLAFLELATVSVSSDGVHFFEFPAVSLTQTTTQVGGFGSLDASNLHDLAGKYIAGYGAGFDLSELAGVSALLNINDITEVRITDVVGSINPLYGTRDSLGNLINDPFTTPFASGGFDLNGVGVINTGAAVPEPRSLILAGLGGLALLSRLRRRPSV